MSPHHHQAGLGVSGSAQDRCDRVVLYHLNRVWEVLRKVFPGELGNLSSRLVCSAAAPP
jgi:hypothetical protein